MDQLALPGTPPPPPLTDPLGEEATAALVALGFTTGEARRAVADTLAGRAETESAERTLEDVVKSSLQRLGQIGVRSSA